MNQYCETFDLDNGPAFINRRRRFLKKLVMRNFEPFNVYLWIHCIGYTESFNQTPKGLLINLISVALSSISDGYTVIFVILNLLCLIKDYRKEILINCVIDIGEFILRISVCLNRKKLKRTVEQIASLYASQAKNGLNFRTKLVILLLTIDIYYFVAVLLWCLEADQNAEAFSYFKEGYFIFAPPPYAKPLSYLFNLTHYVGMLSPFVTVFFCCLCHMLKHTLLEFKENLVSDRNLDTNQLFRKYNEITSVITVVNDFFHNMLLNALIILLVWTFYSTYNLVLAGLGSALETASQVMLLVSVFAEFVTVCIFASFVTKAVTDVNEAIYLLPFDAMQVGNLPFLLKANREFHGFRFFDTIVIDKTLIFSAIGSLLTYGILIATFSISS